MNTYIRLGDNLPFAIKYVNLVEHYRTKTPEELYEGWMRSDFTGSIIYKRSSDSIEVVRLNVGM